MDNLLKYNNEEFNLIIKDIIDNPTVRIMQNYKQHYDTSCYEHCMNVAYYSYLFCKRFHLNYVSAARASMLHDLFLYDWRIKLPNRKGLHGFTHPKTALKNAEALFDLSNKEKDIILKHMWPITITLPNYIESYVVTFADKFCAIQESFSYYKKTHFNKFSYKYAYLLFNILLFKMFY